MIMMRKIVLALVGMMIAASAVKTQEKPQFDPKIEAEIRKRIRKPDGELTKADFEKVISLSLINTQLSSVTGLEKLTNLTYLTLNGNKLTKVPDELEKLTKLTNLLLRDNQLTSVAGLEKLMNLKKLNLWGEKLTKSQIEVLQKALPKCRIFHNAK